jgi:hypothetical protein
MVAAVFVATLCVLAALALAETPEPGPTSSAVGTPAAAVNAQAPRRRFKYAELQDLVLDIATRMCSRMGALMRPRRGFSWRTRCDLLYEAVEHSLISLGDAMVNELDLTQKRLVDEALRPQNFYNLVVGVRKAVKETLTHAKPPTEGDVERALHRLLSQVILSAATEDPGHAEEMMGLPRDAARNAQQVGLRLPTYGLVDADELDEDSFLTGRDLQWAQAQRIGGAAEVDVTDAAPLAHGGPPRIAAAGEGGSGGGDAVEGADDGDFTAEQDERLIDDLSREDWLIR